MLTTLRQIKVDSAMCWKLCVMLCLTVVASILPDLAAAAATTTTLDNTLCKVTNTLTGRAGKAIATVGVVFMGIGLFMGKMSWSVALAIGLGVAAIFGAGTIINFIGGSGAGGADAC